MTIEISAVSKSKIKRSCFSASNLDAASPDYVLIRTCTVLRTYLLYILILTTVYHRSKTDKGR